MDWVVAGMVAWLLLAVVLAVMIGRSIRTADRRSADIAPHEPNFVIDEPSEDVPVREPAGSAVPVEGLHPEPPVADPSPQPAPPSDAHDVPTIPGIPSARPVVGRPPVPHPIRRPSQRRSGSGGAA